MQYALENINLNGYVVVGVSAGPDSMCLLHLLQNKTNNIIVCHINHNVRKESNEEEIYLKDYCKNNNIIFESMTIKEYKEKNFEAEARKKRYAFYEEILKKYNSNKLFLAHHGDDLIETVLMKIVRGSSIEGYAGIKTISNVKNYQIIRPLLQYTKEDIINYNEKHNIKYYIDKTNNNTEYTRNRYRKNLLPMLKEEDKNVHLKFLKYSNTLQEYNNYIKNLTEDKVKKIYIDNKIDINKLKKEDNFIIKNILYYILNTVYSEDIITEKHIFNIMNLLYTNIPNQKLDMPKNKILIKEYNYMYLTDKIENIKNYKIELKDNTKINNITFKIVKEEEKDDNSICRIDTNNIKMPLYFRNKKDGDYIILKGCNKTKKIKEIFIECKIPASERKTYPILVDSNDNIIWIPNIKKSKFCNKKNENYDIIVKCN